MRIMPEGTVLMKSSFFLILLFTVALLLHPNAHAEIKVIEADSVYIMGDNDSKVNSRRIATQEAKRKALELAGTYVESLTIVRNFQLTRDDVKAYSAGILETDVVAEQMRGTTEHPEIYIRAKCTIDTDVLAARISRYRENEDLKEQLDASVRENDALKKERDALVKQLAADRGKTQAEQTQQKLDAVLTREELNDDTARIWTTLAPQFDEEASTLSQKQSDLERSAARLEQAVRINPRNQRAYCLLSFIYQKMGDYAAAEERLRTAIHHLPSAPAPHLRLGILLRQRGRYPEAMKEFHFVERVRPHNLPVVFYSGMTYKDMGKCGKAVQYLNRFLKAKSVDQYPGKKELALAAIEQCGGNRPGRQRKAT
jgi:tetratricopeptide (TPR) repeat protein